MTKKCAAGVLTGELGQKTYATPWGLVPLKTAMIPYLTTSPMSLSSLACMTRVDARKEMTAFVFVLISHRSHNSAVLQEASALNGVHRTDVVSCSFCGKLHEESWRAPPIRRSRSVCSPMIRCHRGFPPEIRCLEVLILSHSSQSLMFTNNKVR